MKQFGALWLLLATLAIGSAHAAGGQLGLTTYDSETLGLSFEHPAGWDVEEWVGDDLDGQARILLVPPPHTARGAGFFLNIWRSKPVNIEKFLIELFPEIKSSGLDSVRKPLDGAVNAYVWQSADSGKETLVVVVETENALYQTASFRSEFGAGTALRMTRSLALENGRVKLSQLDELSSHSADWNKGDLVATQAASTCTNCSETDPSTNSYTCVGCGSFGNCTWKTEAARSGNDNFKFTGSGRDAYKWMSLNYSTQATRYVQGGNVPAVGAVMVMISSLAGSGGFGHVATVTGVRSDGSVDVTEQNCYTTCTQTKNWTLSSLRTSLAGYIYNGATPPSVSSKTISSTIGSTTVIDDHNLNGVYNFRTDGPGTVESFNGSQRAWYSASTGAYNSFMYATRTSSTAINKGTWFASVIATGVYELGAYIPNNTSRVTATAVRYSVNGSLSSPINQSSTRGIWVKIVNPSRTDGNWPLSSGSRTIQLLDTQGGAAGNWLAFDAVRFIRRS